MKRLITAVLLTLGLSAMAIAPANAATTEDHCGGLFCLKVYNGTHHELIVNQIPMGWDIAVPPGQWSPLQDTDLIKSNYCSVVYAGWPYPPRTWVQVHGVVPTLTVVGLNGC
ncbi:hypothetical protein SAMN05421504_103910 [Amycolatopsis xylanica]|uniref:Peptidase inhibitor family I36 n=1 Tax=Amycolatopsis xylanica TaxID=589385 RepID=A0A1H3EP91_9PSEU|nr:hypothetical protein [Amycolatopsis xylanica]SDX80415.1 hypothetical protein SAMN05421504_103910 [Amycolatopsis xylanica]